MTTIRASSTPRLLACPASHHAPGERINPDSPEARLGSGAHVVNETLPKTGQPDWDRIPEVAREFRVEEKELRILAAQSKRLWDSEVPGWDCTLADIFEGATAEGQKSMGIGLGVTLTGSPDLFVDRDNNTYVLDWKTGRVDRDHTAQLAAYALLAGRGKTVGAHVFVAWVRDGELEQWSRSTGEIDDHRVSIAKAAASWDGEYRPGSHCAFCPLEASCSAKTALVRRDIGAILDSDAEAFGALEPARQIGLVEQARDIERLCKRVVDAAREHVSEHGDIEADGRALRVTTVERQSVDTRAAMAVLRQHIPAEKLADTVTVQLGKAKKIAGEDAPRGEKGKRIAKLMDDLEKAGALSKTETKKLEIKRTA